MSATAPVYDAKTQKALDIEYHRKVAASYDQAVTRYFRFYHVHSLHPWVRRLVAAKPGATALDVGTGTGVVACTLARFGCRVRAIDHSPEMLAHARARAESMGVLDHIEFDRGDGEKLPYPDCTFDAVTIQGVLHHLPDVMPMLHEAARVLKCGGEFYVSEPCLESAWVARMVHASLAPLRLVKRVLRGRPEPEPDVSDHEKPISGPAFVAQVRSLGFATEAEFLIRTGLVRPLPQRLKIWVTLLLSWPTRRSHGDMMFVIARKPD